MGHEVLQGPGAFAFDPMHIIFDVIGLGLSGYSAADWLRQYGGIHVELTDHRRLMALITFADNDVNADRLIAAVEDLVHVHSDADPAILHHIPPLSEMRMETVVTPRATPSWARPKWSLGAEPPDGSPPR